MKTILVWWITCGVWSTVWLAIKLGVTDVPPFGFAAARLAIAMVVLSGIVMAQRRPIPGRSRDRWIIAGTGLLLLGVNYTFLYWGAQYITSGLSAVLQATTPLFALLFGHYVLHDDRITSAALAALGLGILGVALIFWTQVRVSGWIELMGASAVVASGACVAVGYALVRRYARDVDPLVLMTGQMLSAFVLLLGLTLVFEGNPLAFRWTRPAVLSLVYLAFAGSIAAFWMNYWLLRHMTPTKMLMTAVVEPMLALALGALFLHETISPSAALGSVLILGSVALSLRRSR